MNEMHHAVGVIEHAPKGSGLEIKRVQSGFLRQNPTKFQTHASVLTSMDNLCLVKRKCFGQVGFVAEANFMEIAPT